jgi:hypothetical protein
MKKLFLILCYVFFWTAAICGVLDAIYCDVTSNWNILMWNFVVLSSLSGALRIRYNTKENKDESERFGGTLVEKSRL